MSLNLIKFVLHLKTRNASEKGSECEQNLFWICFRELCIPESIQQKYVFLCYWLKTNLTFATFLFPVWWATIESEKGKKNNWGKILPLAIGKHTHTHTHTHTHIHTHTHTHTHLYTLSHKHTHGNTLEDITETDLQLIGNQGCGFWPSGWLHFSLRIKILFG